MKFSEKQIRNIADSLSTGMLCFVHLQTGEVKELIDRKSEFYSPTDEVEEEWEKFELIEHEYKQIETYTSSYAYHTMKLFAEDMPDKLLRERLLTILERPKPFANFKYEIDDSPYRQHWFDFRLQKYMLYVKEQIERLGFVTDSISEPRKIATNKREWNTIKEYKDIKFDFFEGIAKITINRPQVYNAFRPETNMEMIDAMNICREQNDIAVIVLTGAGEKAFCSGGDQNVKGIGGYIGEDGVPRLNVLDLHKVIRSIPKPVIAMVNGYAIGGGHVLHVVCDLTIASDNAIFGQTGPKVGSFDAGFGASYLARHIGQKKAREMWFLCKQYTAHEALEMGLINAVVPLANLEETTIEWCKIIMKRSPMAIRMIKRGLNAELDGQHGLMEFAGDATLMYYLMEEAQEGKNAFLEKRDPNFQKYPKFP